MRFTMPVLNACDLRGKLAAVDDAIVAIDFAVVDQNLWLCDFASFGEGGSPYPSWPRVKNARKTDFSRHNPLRKRRYRRLLS